jgi:hypothetical protein
VDVLGEIEENAGKISIKKILRFPSWLVSAVYSVSMELNMPVNWFNAGPTQQLDYGLPSGFEARLEKISYGEYLNIYYISRIDQIFFKLNHSICVGGIGYQVDDLFSLNPTGEELFQACKWVLNQYNSKDVREILLNFLKKRKLWVLLDKVKKEK